MFPGGGIGDEERGVGELDGVDGFPVDQVLASFDAELTEEDGLDAFEPIEICPEGCGAVVVTEDAEVGLEGDGGDDGQLALRGEAGAGDAEVAALEEFALVDLDEPFAVGESEVEGACGVGEGGGGLGGVIASWEGVDADFGERGSGTVLEGFGHAQLR